MPLRNEPDETLVMLTLAGEQTAYEILVTRYQRSVIASAMTVTKTRFMAEDAAQDAFVTAWMKLNTLREPDKYGQWVCRIAKNCALNMIERCRDFIPLDAVENLDVTDGGAEDPAELYALSEERREVGKSIGMLPEKVRQIILLHYFDDLSVAEIADRMSISEGTVKRQLYDGRKKIRKELCAMNEKYSDTLVRRVMKKVEELKLWQVRKDKSGFEKVYAEVLSEVEELPESSEKQYALADVLMRGWWWIPGKKNDALFARITAAATESKNEEVMIFIASQEDSKRRETDKIDFIRDEQIPRLEKAGFIKALGREWFRLGNILCDQDREEEGRAAYEKAGQILPPDDVCRILIPYALKMYGELADRYKDTPYERFKVGADAAEYRFIGGKPHFWAEEGVADGYLASADLQSPVIFFNASACDGAFFADISVGETVTGSDGARLTYLSDNETADTPAGRFEGCRLWEVRRWGYSCKIVCRTYYKDGVGIVRQDHITDGVTSTQLLSGYEIKGGDGLLPLYPGNSWEYVVGNPGGIVSELKYTVPYADDEKAVVAFWESIERVSYDETSWADAAQEIAQEYAGEDKKGNERVFDVTPAIERAERLAVTPMEKAHTKVAASTVKRIMETDPDFNPDYKATGHWNFFEKNYIRKKDGSLFHTGYNPRWSFEWKNCGTGSADEPLLYNDVLGILQDATNCVWSDEWQIGASPIVEYSCYSHDLRTRITCEDGGTVETKAGTFENCLKLLLDIDGWNEGWSYRGGRKVYYFADGIGIVRTENEYCGGARTAVYELTSYSGRGEGYMPLADGLERRYDALDLTDGYTAWTEYTFVADEDGDIVVFSDRAGIRVTPPPITEYSSIQNETIERKLWNSGKRKEGQIKYGANTFHLLLHMIGRPSYNRTLALRSVEIQDFYMKTLENLGENGEVPSAWLPIYARTAVIKAAALFGNGQKEEGYETLETVLGACEKIAGFRKGDVLDVGQKEMFGGIGYEYGNNLLVYPDGAKEPVSYEYFMKFDAGNIYSILTATRGWEWFNSVRSEDRFREYAERARKLMKK